MYGMFRPPGRVLQLQRGLPYTWDAPEYVDEGYRGTKVARTGWSRRNGQSALLPVNKPLQGSRPV